MSLSAVLRAQARVLEALAAELEQLERATAAPSPEAWFAVGRPHADLGCSSGELRAAVKRGELVATTSGRRVLVRRGDVLAWLERRAARRTDVATPATADPLAATASKLGLRLVGGRA